MQIPWLDRGEKPAVSVVMNTARGGYGMTYLRERHHLEYTINSFMRRQDFRGNWEFIIADMLHPRSEEWDWNALNDTPFPIYHVPVENSLAKDMGYVCICATKNAGLAYAEGRYIITLDDCCSGPANYISRIMEIHQREKTFPNPLHVKMAGDQNYYDADGNWVVDSRFAVLDHHKTDRIAGLIHGFGYATFSLDAILKINGHMQLLDFSRQMEDQFLSEQFWALGHQIGIYRNLLVHEQEHLPIAKTPLGKPGIDVWTKTTEPDKAIKFRDPLMCVGPIYFLMKELWPQSDFTRSNSRGFTEEEKRMLKPCYKLDPTTFKCAVSNMRCNWIDSEGRDMHFASPDAKAYFDNPPIFDLAEIRRQKLSVKHQYRVK